MHARSILASAAVAVFAALPASAPAHADPQGAFVRSHAIDMIDGLLNDAQIGHVQSLAYQAAVASSCEGFVIDAAKFGSAFEKLVHESEEDMTDEQKTYFEQHLLFVYGVFVGGELAHVAEDPGMACAMAMEAKADPEAADMLVWE